MLSRRWAIALLLISSAPSRAQWAGRASSAEKAAKRFPQPVRVGDLIGRPVLEPKESEDVLGRVAAIRRAGDGGIDLLLRSGGVLGVGTRLVAVPIEAVALLGELLVLVDITPEQLGKLPTAPDTGDALGADETIRVGLVRPYH